MGYYINPPNEEKEVFLHREGITAPINTKWEDIPKGYLPVMLISNGMFSAAGVCYSPRELEKFRRPDDRRLKLLLIVEIEKLLPVVPFLKEVLGEQ